MKVFCYFVEPASYTLELASNVYDKHNIEYSFINSKTFAESNLSTNKNFLDRISLFSRIRYVYNVYRNNDLIIVNGYNNYPFIMTFFLNLFSFNKKYIATESDTQLIVPSNIIKRFIKWIYLSIIFKNKYVLGFAGGNYSHKDLFRNYGMDESRIFLMPLMINNEKFYCERKEKITPFTFLFVGRLVMHKNVEALIEKFNAYFADKNAVLRIVGAGEQEVYLKSKYESKQVIFVGKKFESDLIKEFQTASCFLCPSIFEPWGLVVNEALSSGLPVIARKEVGACFDLILGKETGFITDDMKDFGEKMMTFFNDEELLYLYSRNASKFMQEKWNYNFYNNCLNDAIEKIKSWQ